LIIRLQAIVKALNSSLHTPFYFIFLRGEIFYAVCTMLVNAKFQLRRLCCRSGDILLCRPAAGVSSNEPAVKYGMFGQCKNAQHLLAEK
jgi:hypothetical protein